MVESVKNINRLPVITWRWLKVNELNLKDLTLPEGKKYNHKALKTSSHGNVIVKEGSNNLELINNLSDREINYGVSKELVGFVENSYNYSISIHAPKREVLKEPIRLEYLMDKENPNLIDNNIIVAEENSEITVIMEYKSGDETEAFHNGVTKVYAKTGAKVNLIKIQNMNNKSKHFDSNLGILDYGAEINYISVEMGGSVSVTNYVNNLEEPTSKSDIKSIYLGDGERIIDLSYEMIHKGRRSESNIETRGVLKDKAKKIFRGTLDFKKGATKAKGSEEEYAILLDSTVKSDAVPLLLCDEDDVQGAHAASAGKIDENKLFYLMSRGFSEKEARKLIVEASFRPIIDEIPVEDIRDYIHDEIQRRLTND